MGKTSRILELDLGKQLWNCLRLRCNSIYQSSFQSLANIAIVNPSAGTRLSSDQRKPAFCQFKSDKSSVTSMRVCRSLYGMADDDDILPPPLEIPWRLASTTLPFSNGEADQTSISLFTHVPDDEALAAKFPDEKL